MSFKSSLNNRKFNKSKLSIAVSTAMVSLMLGSSLSLNAAEQDDADAENVIVVTGIKGSFEQFSSMGMLRFSDQKISNSREAMMAFQSYIEFLDLLHIEMLNRGVFFISRGMFILSTPMGEKEIDKTAKIFGETLQFLKPVAVETGLSR